MHELRHAPQSSPGDTRGRKYDPQPIARGQKVWVVEEAGDEKRPGVVVDVDR